MDTFDFDASLPALKKAVHMLESLLGTSKFEGRDMLLTLPVLLLEGSSNCDADFPRADNQGLAGHPKQPNGDMPGIFRTTYD